MRAKLIGIILAMLLPLQNLAFAVSSGPTVGQVSPNLIGRMMDDKLYRLSADKTRAKVINFFWVECKPCKLEMPELAEMEKANPKVKFISVHTKEVPAETVASFIKSLKGAPSNIVLTTGSVQDTFKFIGLPHTMVLDKNNVVLANFEGYTPANTKALKKLIQELGK